MNSAKRSSIANYEGLLTDVVDVIADARRAAARVVNAAMSTAYRLIGRRIIEEEQRGTARADYGEQLVERLALDLSKQFGRGFSKRNLWQMRAFYVAWPLPGTMSAQSPSSATTARAGRIVQTLSAQLTGALAKEGAALFPLPWSPYTNRSRRAVGAGARQTRQDAVRAHSRARRNMPSRSRRASGRPTV